MPVSPHDLPDNDFSVPNTLLTGSLLLTWGVFVGTFLQWWSTLTTPLWVAGISWCVSLVVGIWAGIMPGVRPWMFALMLLLLLITGAGVGFLFLGWVSEQDSLRETGRLALLRR